VKAWLLRLKTVTLSAQALRFILGLFVMKNYLLSSLFTNHINFIVQEMRHILDGNSTDHLVIVAGGLKSPFADDIEYAYRPNHYIKRWLPENIQPGVFVHVSVNCTEPTLWFPSQDDFWLKAKPLPDNGWVEAFEIKYYRTETDLKQLLSSNLGTTVVLGEVEGCGLGLQSAQINPPWLIEAVDLQRARKTPYELECLKRANERAVKGHLASRAAFESGQSEYQIYHAFLLASQHREMDIPYEPTVAINHHCSILHYLDLDTELPDKRYACLVDGGASYAGYASDICRTYCYDDSIFSELINGLDDIQQSLVQAARPGVSYADLHREAHLEIAALLIEGGVILSSSAESAVSQDLSLSFFPHGLGHFIGTQVHERGGNLGMCAPNDELSEKLNVQLRLTRTIEPDNVFTIEPGIYFNPVLLKQLKNSHHQKQINWPLVEQLIPYGGMRIEDVVIANTQGAINLTRNAFAAVGGFKQSTKD